MSDWRKQLSKKELALLKGFSIVVVVLFIAFSILWFNRPTTTTTQCFSFGVEVPCPYSHPPIEAVDLPTVPSVVDPVLSNVSVGNTTNPLSINLNNGSFIMGFMSPNVLFSTGSTVLSAAVVAGLLAFSLYTMLGEDADGE